MKLFKTAVILSTILASTAQASGERIINGVEVPKGMFGEVIQVRADGASCTATVVGPNALILAAHCVKDGGSAEFSVDGRTYVGKGFRHPDYPSQDKDVGLIITPQAISGLVPASIGGSVNVGDRVFLLGFGCTTPGGGGGNDGVLRMGESDVLSFSQSDFVSKRVNGGALCFGDSGGPTMAKEAGKFRVVGINSKGNIQDTNYSLHLALPSVQSFLKDTAKAQNVDICGVTSTCESVTPGEPHFKKSLYSYSVESGEVYEQKLPMLLDMPNIAGLKFYLDPSAPEWMEINGMTLTIAPPKTVTGSFRVSLTAKSPLGADATLIYVNITGPVVESPLCALAANPSFIRLGESLVLTMKTSGQVSSALLIGQSMPALGGTKTITPVESGVFTATGTVTGPGGSGTCSVRYGVK